MIKIKTVVLASAVIGLGFLAAGKAAQEIEARQAPRGPVRAQAPRPDSRKQGEQAGPATGKHALPDYIVEPPDMIIVEVLDALPGRPITGGRLVRPDGKVSLGFYGEVYVAGLTLEDAKIKIVKQLQKHLSDDMLGLSVAAEKDGKIIRVEPKDTDRVYVDVSAYNSKFYYVQGDVAAPGRLHVTGNDTVLDAINFRAD